MVLNKSTRREARRLCSVFCLLLLLTVGVSAYTVVMRGGRHVEIPAEFLVTPTTLTYEISPGIQVTLLMSAIDIAATERINKEPAGSLLKRAQSADKLQARSVRGPIREPNTAHSITNRNLEGYERTRRQSEVAYEKRRKELGLPSLEESRERAAAQAALMDETFASTKSQEVEAESYWRGQASALRNEMTAVDAEIRYTRMRLDELSVNSGLGSFGILTSVSSFGGFDLPFGRPAFRSPFGRHQGVRPNIVVAPNAGVRGAVRFGGGITRGNVFLNPGMPQFPRRDVRGFGGSFWPNASVLSWPLQSYDYSYERSALVTRLDELMAFRASLNARWQILEDDARRAGALPGWLRP